MIKKLICAAALLMVAGLQHTRLNMYMAPPGFFTPQRGYAARQDFSVRVFLSASGGYPEALEL